VSSRDDQARARFGANASASSGPPILLGTGGVAGFSFPQALGAKVASSTGLAKVAIASGPVIPQYPHFG